MLTFLLVEVKNKELFGSQTIGVARLALPKNTDKLLDVWVPMLDPKTHVEVGGDVHMCLQVQPIAQRNELHQSQARFDGNAAASTINDILSSLERLKASLHKISGKQPEALTKADTKDLQDILTELKSFEVQVRKERSLTDEWRINFLEFITSYSHAKLRECSQRARGRT